jgi:hypothetical protein
VAIPLRIAVDSSTVDQGVSNTSGERTWRDRLRNLDFVVSTQSGICQYDELLFRVILCVGIVGCGVWMYAESGGGLGNVRK